MGVAAGWALALLAACANSSASTEPNERVAAQTAPTEPQQVVQRMEAAIPERAASERAASERAASEGALQAPAEGKPTVAELGPAAVAAGGASAQSEEPRAEGTRPAAITPKHLEAELNRLEDELKK